MNKLPHVAAAMSDVVDIESARIRRMTETQLDLEAKRRAAQIYARMVCFWEGAAEFIETTCGKEMVARVMHEVAELMREPWTGEDDGHHHRGA